MLIRISVTGLQELGVKPREIRSAIHLGLRESARAVHKDILSHFDRGVSPDGIPWAPLRPSTVKRKGGRGKMLVRSGVLRMSLWAKRLGPLAWSIETGVPYAGLLQHGTPKMVPRPFMGISRGAVDQTANILVRRLQAVSYGQLSGSVDLISGPGL